MTGTYPTTARTRPSAFEVDMPWQDATFATLPEATEWLDYLESHDVREQKCSIVGDEFHVRWR